MIKIRPFYKMDKQDAVVNKNNANTMPSDSNPSDGWGERQINLRQLWSS